MATPATTRQVGPLPFWDAELQRRDDATGITDASISSLFPQDYPIYATDPWDIVTLAGARIPGVCEVDSKSMRDISVKRAKGRTGASYTVLGYKPSEVVIRVHLWSPEQFTIFRALMLKLWPREEKDPFPTGIPIYHPGLALWGIKTIVIAEVDTPKPGKVVGAKLFTIKCQEYTPAKKGGKPKAIVVGVPGVTNVLGPTAPAATFGSGDANLLAPFDGVSNTNQPPPPSATDGNFAANLLGGGP